MVVAIALQSEGDGNLGEEGVIYAKVSGGIEFEGPGR